MGDIVAEALDAALPSADEQAAHLPGRTDAR